MSYRCSLTLTYLTKQDPRMCGGFDKPGTFTRKMKEHQEVGEVSCYFYLSQRSPGCRSALKRFGSSRQQRKSQVVMLRNSPATTRRSALPGYLSRFAAVRVQCFLFYSCLVCPSRGIPSTFRTPMNYVSVDLNLSLFHSIFGWCYGCSRGRRSSQTTTAAVMCLLSWRTPRPRLKKKRPGQGESRSWSNAGQLLPFLDVKHLA